NNCRPGRYTDPDTWCVIAKLSSTGRRLPLAEDVRGSFNTRISDPRRTKVVWVQNSGARFTDQANASSVALAGGPLSGVATMRKELLRSARRPLVCNTEKARASSKPR